MAFLDNLEDLHGKDAFGYCTNFMIFGEGIDFEPARVDIADMGESAVIVGDDKIVKVHSRPQPRPRVRLCRQAGGSGADQDRQHAGPDLEVDGGAGDFSETPRRRSYRFWSRCDSGGGAGTWTGDALRWMGAAGWSRRPDRQSEHPEILESVERVGAPDVILLPNNPNVILSALQAASMSAKRVSVIPTRSVPQGLAALEAYNGDSDLESNIARMTDSVAAVRTIELTRAVRDATINDIAVAEGEWIVLLDDRLVASGPDEDDVIRKALAGIDIASAELVTVFLGAGATEDAAAALEATLFDLNTDLDIQAPGRRAGPLSLPPGVQSRSRTG